VSAEIDPGVERIRVRLIGDNSQRAALRGIAEQRPLGAAECLDPFDINQAGIRVEAGDRNGLLVEINGRRWIVAERDAGNCAAAHDDVGSARVPGAE
jgi:hypothetical protein